MNTTVSHTTLFGALFLFALLSGVWLSHSGRPIHNVIFTIHKLIALAAAIAFGVIAYRLYQAGDLRAIMPLSALVVTGIFLFLGLFVSGAWLSRDSLPAQAVLRIHQIAPLLAVVSSAATLVRLARGGL